VFAVPRPGDDDFKFEDWCAEHPDLFVVVSERRPRPAQVVLHRTTCALLVPETTDGPHLRTCGTRAILVDSFTESEIAQCSACL
jgi:hypothetical protein